MKLEDSPTYAMPESQMHLTFCSERFGSEHSDLADRRTQLSIGIRPPSYADDEGDGHLSARADGRYSALSIPGGFDTMHQQETWPALPLAEWQETYTTLHMYSQVVGKVRLESSPMTNHWWQVPLYLTARGLTTSPITHGDKSFQLDFDLFDHELVVLTSEGETRRIPLGSAVKNFYARVMDTLEDLGVAVEIWPVPVEVANPVPFEQDERSSYEPLSAHRFWQILRRVDAVFKQFRARFAGKCSPVQFYWGSFDLAVTRFSGRPAPPSPDADVITRFSYNAELSSLGFWPGGTFPSGEGVREVGAAFYSYTFPEPPGFPDQPVWPEEASYDSQLGEFLLLYDDVRAADDPRRAILDFAQWTYEAGVRLQGWPMDELALQDERPPRPRERPQETSEIAAQKAPNPYPRGGES